MNTHNKDLQFLILDTAQGQQSIWGQWSFLAWYVLGVITGLIIALIGVSV